MQPIDKPLPIIHPGPRPDSGRSADPWRVRVVLRCLAGSVVLQWAFLPCLCHAGTAKTALAFVLDVLVLLRAARAGATAEKGLWWVFYSGLALTSWLWIPWLSVRRVGGC